MSNNWTKLTTVGNIHTAEIICGMLNENGVKTNILNKRDSEIPTLGDVEIYVLESEESKAKQLINEQNQPE